VVFLVKGLEFSWLLFCFFHSLLRALIFFDYSRRRSESRSDRTPTLTTAKGFLIKTEGVASFAFEFLSLGFRWRKTGLFFEMSEGRLCLRTLATPHPHPLFFLIRLICLRLSVKLNMDDRARLVFLLRPTFSFSSEFGIVLSLPESFLPPSSWVKRSSSQICAEHTVRI